MKPAIIFDMDGVIVRSEQLWDEREPSYLRKILQPPIAEQIIGKTRGCSVSMIYEWAKRLGHTGSYDVFFKGYDELAVDIYTKGHITSGIDELIGQLQTRGVRLAVVSASPINWVMAVVNRLQHKHAFQFIESVNAHQELKPKPAPDGYIAAMKTLHALPGETLIIEDSQTGINSAITSGAHVCCFTLHAEEPPHGVDTYAHTIEELSAVCQSFAGTMTLNSPGLS